MIRSNVKVRVLREDGTVKSEHIAHNTLTAAGLTLIARLLTGEETSNVFVASANNVKLNNTSSVINVTENLGPVLAPNGARFKTTYTPTADVTWTGQTLTLNIATMSVNTDVATVTAASMTPALTSTDANTSVEIIWEIDVDFSGRTIVAGGGRGCITGGAPYVPATHSETAEARMWNIIRGVTSAAPFNNLSGLVLEVNSLSQEANLSDDQTLTALSDVEATVVTRSGAVITLAWSVPASTEASVGARERVFTPIWKSNTNTGRTPLSAYRQEMPQGVAGQKTAVSTTLTVTQPSG